MTEGTANITRTRGAPLRCVLHRRHHVTPPAHHVVQEAGTRGQALLDSLPLLPSLLPSQPEQLYSTEQTSVFLNAGPCPASSKDISEATTPKDGFVRTGFQNPWDSWHKPTLSEVWNGLHWGQAVTHKGHAEYERYKVAIEEARLKESGQTTTATAESDADREDTTGEATSEQLDGLQDSDLAVYEPDFGPAEEDHSMVRATWLGHATTLLQVPPIGPDGEPVRVLFDPIFSMRCSPTQYVGPIRLYPPPCPIHALPRVDVVCISHSHYDHLDYDSIVQLWKVNSDHLRFVVPLGNKAWFVGLGLNIDEDRVTELDWWDEVWLSEEGCGEGERIRLICTPAQHGSGRYGVDAGRTLWSSWTLERITQVSTFRAFFGGDTGFQFHSSDPLANEYPTCPAFEEVQRVLGPSHLSFLPISVGATLNFVKSYDAFGLVPELDGGLTGANHMTPYDAVRVAKILSGRVDQSTFDDRDRQEDGRLPSSTADGQQSEQVAATASAPGVVMSIHWGTFVSGMDELRRSMHDLEAACMVQGVKYVRDLDQRAPNADRAAQQAEKGELTFACIDHGRTIWLKLPSDTDRRENV